MQTWIESLCKLDRNLRVLSALVPEVPEEREQEWVEAVALGTMQTIAAAALRRGSIDSSGAEALSDPRKFERLVTAHKLVVEWKVETARRLAHWEKQLTRFEGAEVIDVVVRSKSEGEVTSRTISLSLAFAMCRRETARRLDWMVDELRCALYALPEDPKRAVAAAGSAARFAAQAVRSEGPDWWIETDIEPIEAAVAVARRALDTP